MKGMESTAMRMTRRQMAGALLAGAAVAQTQPAETDATASAPATPEAELQAAKEQNRQTAESLAKVAVAMATEPAVHFTA
jgi:hypothetical protein